MYSNVLQWYYIREWRVTCWWLYLITWDYCQEQENTIMLCDLQIYRKRERAKGGGWVVRGGGWYTHTTPQLTHTHLTHTLYIITIYNLNEGFKHFASLHCPMYVVDVDF